MCVPPVLVTCDFLGSADRQVNATAEQPTSVYDAYSEESLETEAADSNAPAVKTAA